MTDSPLRAKGRAMRRNLMGAAYADKLDQQLYADPIMEKFAALTIPADSERFCRGAALLGLNALGHCRTQWESGFVGPRVAHGPALNLIGSYS